ncbi:hypothetical protein [Singulisphaera sp. PoT]|uniref:hypothetical protein n=1 Tax=Singulisphaera sp. PoT TaxID=3411797 RepID=UPI003BF5B0A4
MPETNEWLPARGLEPRRQAVVEALRLGSTLEEAAAKAGVSSRTLRRWRADDPELEQLVEEAMSRADDMVEAVTLRNCLDPDPSHNALRMFWLKSRRPEVYRDAARSDNQASTTVIVIHADESKSQSEG